MAIFAPDELKKVGMGQSRGSSIAPVDTYAPPAVQKGDRALGDLADGLAGLGGQFSSLAADIAMSKEKEALNNVEYYVGQVRSEIKDGVPIDVQLGSLLPEQSVTVRARVAESIGYDTGLSWVNNEYSRLMADDTIRLDPARFQAEVARIRSQAAGAVKGQPGYGAGYMKAVEGVLNKATNNATESRTNIMMHEQDKQYGRDLIEGINGSVRGSMNPNAVYDMIKEEVTRQGLVGYKPPDGEKYGIKTGSADEWANFYTRLAYHESGLKNSTVGDVGQFNGGSRGLFQLSYHDALNYKLNDGKPFTPEQLADPRLNASAAITISKSLMEANGGIRAGMGKYWGPISREGWTPGRGRDANLQFDPSVKGETGPAWQRFADGVLNSEVPVNPQVANAGGGQARAGGFIESNWVDLVRKYGPEQFKNLPPEQIANLRNDPKYAGLTREVVQAYAKETAATLEKNGIEPTVENLQLAQLGGPTNGMKLVKASDNAKVGDILGEEAVQANPALARMTVGELKATYAQKRGEPVDRITAGQNAVRGVDRNWSRTGGLANVARRDAAAKYLLQQALDSGDASYLDYMPPEWMTPEIKNQFLEGRRKVEAIQYAQQEHARKIEENRRKDEERGMKWEIDQAYASGLPVDPRKYANNNEAFNYALKMQREELYIDPSISQSNANTLAARIEAAAMSNDFSKLPDLNRSGPVPSAGDIEAWIDNQPDIKAVDRIELKKLVPTLLNVAINVGGTEADGFFKENLGSDLKVMSQSLYTQMNPLNVPAFEGEARRAYDAAIRDGFKAYVMENGVMPTGQARLDVYNKGLEAARQRVEAMKQALIPQKSSRGTGPANPKNPAGQPLTPSKPKLKQNPDGTWVPN